MIMSLLNWMAESARPILTTVFCLIVLLRLAIWAMGGDPFESGYIAADVIIGLAALYVWLPKRLRRF